MESRFRRIFLNAVKATLFLLPVLSFAAELEEKQELKPVIQPEIVREKFDESKIKSSDYEVIASAGIISIEDFGANPALILKFNYHIADEFFTGIELLLAKGSQTSFETLSGGAPLFSEDEREMTTYLITLGYNAFPGEAFLTDNLTYNTSFYVIGGIGNTVFGNNDHFTASIGAGYRMLVTNFLSAYIDFRDNIFNDDTLGTEKTTHNLLFTVGAGFYF